MTDLELQQKIEAHSAATGLAPSTICERGVGNSRLYQRLCDGYSCTQKTAGRLVAYMASHPAPQKDGVEA